MKDKIAVIGLGISGIATTKFLISKNIKPLIFDDNKDTLKKVKNKFGNNVIAEDGFCEWNWQKIKTLVLSPGIPLHYPKPHEAVVMARKFDVEIICDIELFYRYHKGKKFIGITGSNGKSTVTALISHILNYCNIKNDMGGNIGKAVFELNEKADVFVIEISSFQLDLINALKFDIAILLNITKDHLERHGNMKNYINAKKQIFKNQKKDDLKIINIDDVESVKIYQQLIKENNQHNITFISAEKVISNGVSLMNDELFINGKKICHVNSKDNLKGIYGNLNIVSAIIACRKIKDDLENITKAIASFKGLPHRTEIITRINKITFINDSKATNFEACQNALQMFDNIYWILGGMKKEGSSLLFLEKFFPKILKAFTIGSAEEEFYKILTEQKIDSYKCNSLQKAVNKAFTEAKKEKIAINILLSPGCASFDQWQNFVQRGEGFVDMVKKLSS